MSKPKLVVLGFLKWQRMHGYQIGQIVESFGLPAWAGIRLPSVYKALQVLEAGHYIRGEQETEGNTPPRKVYHINEKGRALHARLVREYLTEPSLSGQDWWLVLSFAQGTISREELLTAIEARIKRMEDLRLRMRDSDCSQRAESGELPFVHSHIARLGKRHHNAELTTLREILKDIRAGGHDEFFANKGDAN